jgi:hypothetical protein
MNRKVVVVCCVCKRVRDTHGRWVRRNPLSPAVVCSHTYCPQCAEHIRSSIRSSFRRGEPSGSGQ